MAPDCGFARGMRCFFLLALALGGAVPAHALRLVNYNITNYPGANGAGRDPYFRTVLSPLGADVVTVQEMQNATGVNQFLGNLNTLEPGQWAAADFFNGNDTDNALLYKPSKVQVLGSWAFYPNPANLLRYVTCWRLKPVGYSAAAAELRVYSQHLKASSGTAYENQRLAEATGIRDSMNAVPPGTNAILLGDFNIYRSTEPAFAKLLESQADNDGRLYDPLNAVGIWNDAAFAAIHTQCPCLTCPPGSGFAGGGLDDRFDMFLPTYNLNDAQGLELLVATYKPVGNDGQHYNLNINDPPTIPEGATYANALWSASDHLPVRVDIQLPARISVASSLALGTVIGGGSTDLAVSNSAPVPAQALQYSFTAPTGFTAPAGSFTVSAGAPAVTHAIATDAGPFGPRAGTLTVTSNDLDSPARAVDLSVTVLDHAVASLDSSVVETEQTLDFGSHAPGEFLDQPARIHNQGYDDVHARLSVNSVEITGGVGRFSLVGGFTTALLAETGRTYEIHFDGSGAAPDSEYRATLIFHGADEPLPGAAAASDLTVKTVARVGVNPTGRGDEARPSVLRFAAPRPNPLLRETVFAFDLPAPSNVALDVFDAGGRRVVRLASGEHPAGRHQVRWLGRDENGVRVPAGLYFARFKAGHVTVMRRIAVLTR